VTSRQSVLGPASTTAEAVTGAVVSFALWLLIGLVLDQGPSAVTVAFAVGVAVLTTGLARSVWQGSDGRVQPGCRSGRPRHGYLITSPSLPPAVTNPRRASGAGPSPEPGGRLCGHPRARPDLP
jgi:hypothetical protein